MGAFDDVIAFALANESRMDRDIGAALRAGHFGEPMPLGAPIGPVTPRGGPTGLILRHGQEVARWGEVDRVDVTFSISKSYLALLAGIAVDDGLIADLDAPVGAQVPIPEFQGARNGQVTWRQLLQLTSEWQGTLWGKPDWIDHYRDLDATGKRPPIGTRRPLAAPGTHWEYNDVRVNVLALALLHLFRRPLPEALRDRILEPIGASDTWDWHGYDTSWVEIDGRRVQSVSGGAHWGGGLWISVADHARVGQLMLQGGRWGDRQVLSPGWVQTCRTPCALNPGYGALWWLNPGRARYPSASEASFFALGVGAQLIWVDPARDMVAVIRWIEKDALSGLMSLISGAL